MRFSQIPFEVRLINYLSLKLDYFYDNINVSNINLSIDNLFWRTYINKFLSFNKRNYPDPLNLIKDKYTFESLRKYFDFFFIHMIKYVQTRDNLILKKVKPTNILLDNIELQYMINYLGERFRTCGFLSTLIATLWNTPEFTREIPILEVAVSHFIVYNKDISLFRPSPIHRLVKLYYTELLRPYAGPYKTMKKLMTNEYMYNLPAVFAAEFPF